MTAQFWPGTSIKRSVYTAEKPRKTVAELLAPARNQISIPGQADSAKTARIKRVSF